MNIDSSNDKNKKKTESYNTVALKFNGAIACVTAASFR